MITIYQGMLCAFLLSLPLGPAMVLCIRNALHRGLWSGFVTGLGAAFADAIYGFAACYGLGSWKSYLIQYQNIFAILGGAILLFMAAFAAIRINDLLLPHGKVRHQVASSFLSTFTLTISSPLTLLGVSSVTTAVTAVDPAKTYNDPYLFSVGMVMGGAFFWALLSFILCQLKKRMSGRMIKGVIYFCSCVLAFMGLFLLLWPVVSH